MATIEGTAGDDVLTGDGGNNHLIGGAGDDLLIETHNGNDLIDGGEGNDTVQYVNVGNIQVRLFAVTVQSGGGAGHDTLISIENVIGGDYGDDLTGNDVANVLDGGSGDDRLDGGGGDDTLIGGLGNDNFLVDSAGDTVIEGGNNGWDVVRARVDYTLPDNVEELFIGGGGRDGTGNALDNILHGSGSSNVLSGLGGADTIRGGGGRDKLLGGDGADLIDGGVGKDTLTGGAARDVFQFRDGDFGATRTLADVITDFSQPDHEKVQLSLVDADTTLEGNQAFAWIGNGALTGVAGQLHYAQQAGNTYVEGDTDGDGTGDFVIALTGAISLTASDFVL